MDTEHPTSWSSATSICRCRRDARCWCGYVPVECAGATSWCGSGRRGVAWPIRSCWAMKSRARSWRSVPMHAGSRSASASAPPSVSMFAGAARCAAPIARRCARTCVSSVRKRPAAMPNTSSSATTTWFICRTTWTSRPAPSWAARSAPRSMRCATPAGCSPGERVLDCWRRRTRPPRRPDCTGDGR